MANIKPWEIPQYTNTIVKTTVNKVDLLLVRPPRAGVILYTKVNNQLYFGLGVDGPSGQLTDLAGGVSYYRDKNVIEGAIREFNEETLNLFEYNVNDFIDSVVLYNVNMLIIFKYMTDINTIRQDFLNLVKDEVEPEVVDIEWFSLNDFKDVIKTRGRMFFRVQTFLQQAGDFYWLL